MTPANLITYSRIILSFIFIYCIVQYTLIWNIAALLVFILAALTDYWDGSVARALNQVSPFGALMDPIADKVLNFSAFFVFAHLALLPYWIVWAMLFREIAVTVFRLWVVKHSGQVIAAQFLGKLKTVVQMILIFWFIFILIFSLPHKQGFLHILNTTLVWLTFLITLYSGILIFIQSGAKHAK
ncbi:MAG: CDP-diacylglycerol--glycerol-3-phosphate 3-phosphatidyltransferase [Candidatus Omnitrophota bacterium]|jgi:CDP-diacylglycerol--glycerol-3-phosphate 3-phosphatidyltransferase